MKLISIVFFSIGIASCSYKDSFVTSKEITFGSDPNSIVIIRSKMRTHQDPYIVSGENGFKIDSLEIYPVGIERGNSQKGVINYPVINCIDIDPCVSMSFKFLKCGNFIVPQADNFNFSIAGFDRKKKVNCLTGVEKETFKMSWEDL